MFKKKEVREPVPEYDFERDDPLVTPELNPSYTVVESYWTRPGLALIVIAITPSNEYVYLVFEPSLTPFEKEVLERLFAGVRDILILEDVALDTESKTKALYDAMDAYLERFEIELEPNSVHKIRYYLMRNYLGWNILDPLQNDIDIEDISCDGYNTPIFLFHRNYRNIRTSIVFERQEDLDAMVVMLAQKTGKHISISSPIVDTSLSDGSRAQLTYGKTVSSHGSSFTIRKFREVPYSPVDLILNQTFTVEEMVFFWLAVEYNQSILFIGGTASGKTTSLNAVAQFIPHLSKVITIEDTREITLSHQNWLASVTPDVTNVSGGDRASIEMFDLLKAAMRQRPEYILVGEVRGVEAQTLFQAMNTGHTTFSTLHAGSVDSAIHRLENEPLNVPRAMIESLDIVSSQVRMYREGKQIRRCNEIVEIVGISETNDVIVNTVFKYRPDTDTPVYSARSEMFAHIAEISGNDMNWISREQQRRAMVIEAMIDQRIRDYRDVSEILWKYYSMPDKVIASLEDLSVLLESGIMAQTLHRNLKADLDSLLI
ncbi:type II/IV secretion system ATPase subunit [Methanocorpusculum vombati]|uniref:Type II/IV secretion system ATPase subunit n=1 Tax=Methanocorpusculum vombati TaxID=3002864 RepID=A0ABT4IJJ3_9EURY|nr:type II/IV secretion system ATPase subunit [Methanocorpusculum vombati]MCZ9320161.1 type II/IV secretion system ATPase subunit [Methanocorpusculum sp.]MCZ0861896.1 type II/IV secretion system ATPase subunit [Methanocorpusculum vombati]MDE2519925.1 type II/IV secretion system ATPase subunit [Methanocorpusculum sp.]MDE2533575.1 type II/IV secretion system ATPase subunit [Methanocorpusculum sp.]MDE2545670.1 type II/IV secretion system ATPase subunit [Methanocorpusculum sp.]